MFQNYVTIGNNIIEPSVNLPRNAILKAMHLLSAEVHINNSHKFKLIHI